MAEGQVTYEIRADDSKVSKDLDKAEKRWNQSFQAAARKQEKLLTKT